MTRLERIIELRRLPKPVPVKRYALCYIGSSNSMHIVDNFWYNDFEDALNELGQAPSDHFIIEGTFML